MGLWVLALVISACAPGYCLPHRWGTIGGGLTPRRSPISVHRVRVQLARSARGRRAAAVAGVPTLGRADAVQVLHRQPVLLEPGRAALHDRVGLLHAAHALVLGELLPLRGRRVGEELLPEG